MKEKIIINQMGKFDETLLIITYLTKPEVGLDVYYF